MSENILKSFYASFAKISPVRVLMKIANQSKLPSGLPDNVLTSPWVPQQAILGTVAYFIFNLTFFFFFSI